MITNKVKRYGSSKVVLVGSSYNEDENVVVMNQEEYRELLRGN